MYIYKYIYITLKTDFDLFNNLIVNQDYNYRHIKI